MFSGRRYFAGQKRIFSYVPFTESWRLTLCLTYFSFCCSRWNIVTHLGGNLETHIFHYEPRIQQEKRWAEKHSLMSGLDLFLSDVWLKDDVSSFNHLDFLWVQLVKMAQCVLVVSWYRWLFRNINHNMQTINSTITNFLSGFRCLRL